MVETTDNVSWEVIDSIGVLRINALPDNKLLSPEFVPLERLKSWVANPQLKGIVVTGEGRHFSSGADLDELKRLVSDYKLLKAQMNAGNELLNYLQMIKLPIVAAISGACFGAGLEIALACHIRICNEKTMIAFPESSLGLIPGMGGTVRLLRNTGIETALQMLLTGDLLDAHTALKAGIVNKVIDEKNVMQYAIDYLKKLVHNRPKEIIEAVIESVQNALRLSEGDALKREAELFCELALKKFN